MITDGAQAEHNSREQSADRKEQIEKNNKTQQVKEDGTTQQTERRGTLNRQSIQRKKGKNSMADSSQRGEKISSSISHCLKLHHCYWRMRTGYGTAQFHSAVFILPQSVFHTLITLFSTTRIRESRSRELSKDVAPKAKPLQTVVQQRFLSKCQQ